MFYIIHATPRSIIVAYEQITVLEIQYLLTNKLLQSDFNIQILWKNVNSWNALVSKGFTVHIAIQKWGSTPQVLKAYIKKNYFNK